MQPFIYALVDPADSKHVRYVGMASRNASRPYSHAKVAHKEASQRFYLYRWIRKIQAEGREPDVMILEQLPEGTSVDLLGFVERCYINSLRSIGHRLTNTAEGGRGGKTISSEATGVISKRMWDSRPDLREQASQRAAMLARTEGNNFGKGQPGLWIGRHHSDETKSVLREKAIRRQNTQEWHDKMSAAIRACDEASPERRRKLSEAAKRQIRLPHSEETRRKIGAAWTDERRASNPNIGRVRPQEERDRISASRKGWKMPEETRAKLREIALARKDQKRLSNGRFGERRRVNREYTAN